MTTRGFDASYNACSYGLLLGFGLAALTTWELARDSVGWQRVTWLAALTLALACDISSNYYGVLAFFPVATSEVVAEIEARKFRVGAWIAMVVGALPLLAYLPLIHANLDEFKPYAWNKPQLSMIGKSYFELVGGLIWPVLGLAAYAYLRRRRGPVQPAILPRPLRLAVAVLLGYPVLGFLGAWAGAGVLNERCLIPVCAGVAMAGAVLLARVGSRRVVIGAVLFLGVWVVARQMACAVVLREQRLAFFHLRDKVERAAAPGEPVIVGDSLMVMPLYWYGSEELRGALVFPVDFAAIHRQKPDNSGEENLWGGRDGVFPVRIDMPAQVIQPGVESVFVGAPKGYMGQELTAEGFALHEDETTVPWQDLNGVSTPLAHPATRIYFALPSAAH